MLTAQDQVRMAVERICSDAFGMPVCLGDEQQPRDWDGRTTVRRFPIVDPEPGMPVSVLIKRYLLDDGHGLVEWAGLDFLSSLDLDPPPTPRCYGGDIEQALVVIEDFGALNDRTLQMILRGNDPDLAATVLVELMAVVGRMHAASIERHDGYLDILERLPTAGALDFHQIHRFDGALERLPDNMSACGLFLDDRVHREIAAIRSELREPGPFLTFVHGDLCPSNVAWVDGRVRIFDLEVSGFRHALLDGVYPQARYLNCQDSGLIPDDVRSRMENAYRSALGEGCPAADDDDLYGYGLVAAGAAWLALLVERIPEVDEKDAEWLQGSVRERIFQALQEFALLADEYGQFPALASVSGDLRERLVDRWGNHKLEMFPAFRE